MAIIHQRNTRNPCAFGSLLNLHQSTPHNNLNTKILAGTNPFRKTYAHTLKHCRPKRRGRFRRHQTHSAMALLDRILELPAELITEVVHSAVHHGTIPCIELQDMKTKLYRPFEGSALLLNIAETKFYTTNVFSAFVGYDPISPATTWPGRTAITDDSTERVNIEHLHLTMPFDREIRACPPQGGRRGRVRRGGHQRLEADLSVLPEPPHPHDRFVS